MPGNKNSGRKKQAASFRVLTGGDEHSRYNDSTTDKELGILTETFSMDGRDYSREEYADLIDAHLTRFEMKTAPDQLLVEMLLDTLMMYQEARQSIREQGAIQDVGGKLVRNPATVIVKECFATIRSAMTELSMTPGTRSGLSAEKKTANPMEALMARRKV